MNKKSFTGPLVLSLAVALVAPAALFVAPQSASASGTSCVGGIIGGAIGSLGASTLSVPNNSFIENLTTGQTAGATLGTCINDLVLMPLARAAIKSIIQNMTASVVSFINGGSGSGGQPSYVPNLSVHLQSVGDAIALPLIAQMATGFNSPFGSVIAASLRNNYAQQTSVAGFYAANQCTLPGSPQSQQAFLAGNWSQGGVGSWLALTTQPQNNPYTLYQAAQAQVGSSVGQAQANRRQDLVQSGGFLSWCGGSSSITTLNGGVSPGAPCTSSDGSPAYIRTPGSIIAGSAQKAIVDSGFDQEYAQLISANDIDTALSAIASALIGQVLGGSGLAGASQPSGTNRPLITQLQNYSSNNTTIAASASASSLAQTTLSNITNYTNAWQTVITAANTASTSVASLASFCTSAALAADTATSSSPQLTTFAVTARAQAAAAQAAIPTEISPVITQAQTAINSVASTQALALKIQDEAASITGATAGASTLAADTQTLVAMPPSTNDISVIQQNAQASGGAKASPAGSLTVSGGTLVDQMNLISTNATALRSACIAPAPSGG